MVSMLGMKKHTNGPLQEKLNELQRELNIFYEISNAMRSTLKLDEILYIILTAITSHAGLGLNRAILFLVNEKDNTIEGKMGIGPGSGEDARKIWDFIDTAKMTLNDLIEQYKHSKKVADSRLNHLVRNVKISINEENGILAKAVLDKQIHHITPNQIHLYQNNPLIKDLGTEEFVVIPLKAHDRIVGIIVADNIFNKKPITEDDIKMLSMFANQAGLAIENSMLYEQALVRAHTDSLTQLWNHGYFQYTLSRLIEQSKQKSPIEQISLLLIDIDNFKNYNDTNGHQNGDIVLKSIAYKIKEQSRKMDFVCRYGGEEFAVILPQTGKEEACKIAERIRKAIEEASPLTVSIGIATFPEEETEKEGLIKLSDMRLYNAKANGKNRISCQ